MKDDFLKDIDFNSLGKSVIPQLPPMLPTHTELSLDQINKELEENQVLKKESQEAQIESLKVLRNIETNTAYLQNVVELLNVYNDNQSEIRNLITDIFNIAAAKDKKEADSLYRKTINKIGTVFSDAETIQKLVGLATAIIGIYNKI